MRTLILCILCIAPCALWAEEARHEEAQAAERAAIHRAQAEECLEWRHHIAAQVEDLERELAEAPFDVREPIEQALGLRQELLELCGAQVDAHRAQDRPRIREITERMEGIERELAFVDLAVDQARTGLELRMQARSEGVPEEDVVPLLEETEGLYTQLRELRERMQALRKEEAAVHRRQERIFKKLRLKALEAHAERLRRELEEESLEDW